MKTRFDCLLVVLFSVVVSSHLYNIQAQGTAFTYQGELQSSGSPVPNGNYDFQLKLYFDPLAVTQIGLTLGTNAVPVTNGLFTITPDFGFGIWDGSNYWLQIGIRSNGVGSYTDLAPLQQIIPVPYAAYAEFGGSASALTTGVALGLGIGNKVADNAFYSFVGGGFDNTIQLTVNYSTIAGGDDNIIQTGDNEAFIGGGAGNSIAASSPEASIVGGGSNSISTGQSSVIGGGSFNTNAATYSVVAGGESNILFSSSQYSVVGGGIFNTIIAGFSCIGGGQGNNAFSSWSVIGGGQSNQVLYATTGSTIGGGDFNTNEGNDSTIAGGFENEVDNSYETIGGGYGNNTQAYYSTVAGGFHNSAWGVISTVAGGQYNSATMNGAVVGGGFGNQSTGVDSAVLGGNGNIASGSGSVVAGGGYDNSNTKGNVASGAASSVGGGLNNQATNSYATVAGGISNIAGGEYSFAAGQQAQAVHTGTFVWADSQSAPFESSGANQFLIRAQGGVGINVTNPAQNLTVGSVAALNVQGSALGGFGSPVGFFENNAVTTGNGPALRVLNSGGTNGYGALCVSANVVPGSNNGLIASFGNADSFVVQITNDGSIYAKAFNLTSDRNAKENFTVVDHQTVLAKVVALPVTQWNYKTDKASDKHIGPVAQDFEAAFGLNGGDGAHISVVDETGVALAAIQGLNEKLNQKNAEIEQLKAKAAEVDQLKQRLDKLEQLLTQKTGGQQ
jgi:hypothetical protein